MNHKTSKTLAIIGFIILNVLLLTVVILYFGAETEGIRNYISERINSGAVSLDDTINDIKELLFLLMIIIFVPWLLNILGIIYMKRNSVASGIMLIISGMLMLYTVIVPVLLITAGSILINQHRYYVKNEKYKPPMS